MAAWLDGSRPESEGLIGCMYNLKMLMDFSYAYLYSAYDVMK